MGPHLVVVPPPLLDADLRVDAVAEPLQRQELVAELAVERFVGAILPRLAGIDERRLNLRCSGPSQDRTRDELRSVVRTQIPWGAVQTHELRHYLDDAARADPASHVDRQTFARPFVDDRQALERLAIRTGIEHKV